MGWKLLLVLILATSAYSQVINSNGGQQRSNNLPSVSRNDLYLQVKNPIFSLPPSLKEVKKQLLEGTGKASFQGGYISSFTFTDSFMSLLNYDERSFSVFGNFGNGKVFALGHPLIFDFNPNDSKKRLVQNVINWMTGNKRQVSVGLLYKSGSDWSHYSWDKLSLQITPKFIETPEDFAGVDIVAVSYYNSWPAGLTPEVINKLQIYVANGGNLFFGSHGWVWELYGQYKQDRSLVYEKNFASYAILNAFGITVNRDFFLVFDPYDLTSNLINCNLNEATPLKLYVGPFPEKNQLLEGTGKASFGGATLSSFTFTDSFMSLLKYDGKSFGVFGNYGKGKVFAFGHPLIFGFNPNDSRKRLVQNTIGWMTGNKRRVSVGLLYRNGSDWSHYNWDKLCPVIKAKFIETPEEFAGVDIVAVNYYNSWPAGLTPEVIDKLKAYVANGGNLFFGSHGWVWELYGQYKQFSSLVYEKNFASYAILNAFGINLNRDSFGVSDPYDLASNLIA